MSEDLRIVISAELDERASADRIAAQLPAVEALVRAKGRIKLDAELDASRAARQARDAASQMQRELANRRVDINVGLSERSVASMRDHLNQLKVDDSIARNMISALGDMDIEIDKITGSWREAANEEERYLQLSIRGTNQVGQTVSLLQTYSAATNEIDTKATSVTENLEKQRKEAAALARQAQVDEQRKLDFLAKQQTILNEMEASFKGTTSDKPVMDSKHLEDLNAQLGTVRDNIEAIRGIQGDASAEQRRDIDGEVKALRLKIAEYRNLAALESQAGADKQRKLDFAFGQELGLDRIQASYSGAGINPSNYAELESKLNKAKTRIEELRKAQGAASEEEKRGIKEEIAALSLKADEYKKLAALAKKDESDELRRFDFIAKYRSELEKLDASYSGKTSAKPVTDAEHLEDLKEQYEEINARIESLRTLQGNASIEMQRSIKSDIEALRLKANEYKNLEYVATSLRTKTAAQVNAEQLGGLQEFEQQLKSAGMLTDDFKKDIETLRLELSDAWDSKSLTAYLNEFGKIEAKVDVFKSKVKDVGDLYKKLASVESQITLVKSQETGLAANSESSRDELAAKKDELKAWEVIKGKIEDQIATYGELVKYARQMGELTDKRAVNEAKLAVATGKVSDEYRRQISVMADEVDKKSASIDEIINNPKIQSSSSSIIQNKMIPDLRELRSDYEALRIKLQEPLEFEDIQEAETALKGLDDRFKKAYGSANSFTKFLQSDHAFEEFEARVLRAKAGLEAFGKKNDALFSDKDLKKEYQRLMNVDIGDPSQLRKWSAELSTFKSNVGIAGKNMLSFGETVKSAISKFSAWLSVTTIVMQGVRAVQAMVENVKELDTAMVELRKVTDETDETYAKFLERSARAAKELGTTIVDLVKSTASFARLGFDMGEAEDLAKVASVYAAVGDGLSGIDDATAVVITAMKAFKIEAGEAISIVDKLNEVGNKYAISSGDIGTGLRNASSALAIAGNSIDQSIAMITAMNEITQDASESGNALKVLSMRLRGAATDIVEAGESTDGMAESTARLREVILALTNVTGKGGFDMMLDEDTFKSTYEIMLGISKVWKDMSNIDQAALIELIAGKQRGNSISALLTSMAQAENILADSLNSAGSAMKEHGKWLDSIEAKITQFKAAFEELSSEFISSDLVKSIIDLGTAGVEALTDLIRTFGSLPAAVGLVTAAMGLLGKQFNIVEMASGKTMGTIIKDFALAKSASSGFAGTFSSIGAALKGNSDIIKYNALTSRDAQDSFALSLLESDVILSGYLGTVDSGSASMKGYREYCKSAGVSLKGLNASARIAAIGATILNAAINMIASALISLAIQGAIKLFDSIAHAAENAAVAAAELAESTRESAKADKEKLDSLNELIAKYEELSSADFIDASAKEDIRNLQGEIVDLVGEQAKGLDLVNGKQGEELDTLRQIRREREQMAVESAAMAYKAAKDASDNVVGSAKGTWLHPAFGNYDYIGGRDKEAEAVLQAAGLGDKYKIGGTLPKAFALTGLAGLATNDVTLTVSVEGSAAERMEQLQEMMNALKEDANYDWSNSELFLALEKQYKLYANGDASGAVSKELLDKVAGIAGNGMKDKGVPVDSIESYFQYRDAIVEAVQSNEALKLAIDSGHISMEGITNAVNELMQTNFPEWFAEATKPPGDGVAVYTKSLSELKETISDVEDSYAALDAAKEDMEADDGKGGLSAETIGKLAKASEKYLDYLYEENGVVRLNTEAWRELAREKLNADMSEIQKETDSLIRKNEELSAKLKANQDAINNIDRLDQSDDRLGDRWGRQLGDEAEAAKAEVQALEGAIEDNSKAIEENQDLLRKYRGIYNSFDTFVNPLDFTDLNSDLGDVESTVANLAAAMEKLAEGTKLTAEELGVLALEYPKLLEASDFFTDGSIKGQEDMLNAVLDMHEQEYDALIDKKIAELEATNGLFQTQLYLEGQKQKLLLEIKEEGANDDLEVQSRLRDKIAEYRDLEGQDYVKMQKGILTVNEDALTSLLEQTNDYGEKSEPLWQGVQHTITGAYEKGSTGGLQALNAFGPKITEWTGSVKEQFKSIARTIAASLAGKELDDGGAVASVNATVKVDVGNTTYDPGGTLGLEGKSIDEWVAIEAASAEKRIEAIEAQYEKNLKAIANLEKLKGLNLKDIIASKDKSGSGSGSGSGSKVDEYIADINKLHEAEERLKEIQAQRAEVEFNIDTAGNTEKRLEYMGELIDLYHQEQEALMNINELSKKVIGENVESMRNVGFDVEWDPEKSRLLVSNMEHINELSKGTTEDTNKLRKEYEDLIKTTISMNDANQANSKSWQDVQKDILATRDGIYDLWKSTKEYDISVMERQISDKAANAPGKLDIVSGWREVLDGINAEIERCANDGYDYASDKIKSLTQDMWGVQDSIKGVLESILSEANDSLDNIQSVYDALNNAAQEFAENQYITVDTFQQIAGLGVEYLAYLVDEEGQLNINRESIEGIVAAKLQNLAVESALNYVRALGAALDSGNEKELNRLLHATDAATESTWGLVYANLALLDLEDDQHQAAKDRIDALRALADTAVSSIGKIDGSLTESLNAQKTAMDDLLKYVIELIKWEVDNQIEGLKQQAEQYRNIVNLQKESLQLAKEKDSYDKDVAKKVKDLAALQNRINQLALDDSREAKAERSKLEEQLAEQQEQLTETQADYSYDAQVETLDKMADAFEKEKDEEIKVLENSISSYQKLYDMAIERISTQWNTLYSDLIQWNYEAGSSVESEITAAWESASLAVQRYGSYVEAVSQIQSQLTAISGESSSSLPNVVGNSAGEYQESENSAKNALASKAEDLIAKLRALGYQWAASSGNATEQNRLAQEGLSVGQQISAVLGRQVVRGSDGVWYLDRVGGERMYDVYDSKGIEYLFKKYHTGGIAGGLPTPKDDEVYALLKKGEPVFTSEQKESLYEYIDFAAEMAAKAGTIPSAISQPIPSGGILDMSRLFQDAMGRNSELASTNSNIEFTVNVSVDGDLSSQAARRIGRDIGDGALERLQDASARRGVRTLAGSTLRQQ
jgi:TP901 family phage tail tape measure protein